jgi:hypothetical protein
MKVLSALRLVIAVTCAVLFSVLRSAAAAKTETRNISIAGLVYNAKNLTPLEAAAIYDAQNRLLGSTDKNGYFKIIISYDKPGEIYFKLRIKKTGFTAYVQNEHWGNLANNSNFIMHFGLNPARYKPSRLSAIPQNANNNDLSYDNVLRSFDAVKQTKTFNDGVEAAKTGNQDVFVNFNDACYLVNNTGWIKLNSATDLVSIDNKQPIPAKKLNATIKRNSIKGMTPLEGKEAKFVVFTK